jgi:Ring finger domain
MYVHWTQASEGSPALGFRLLDEHKLFSGPSSSSSSSESNRTWTDNTLLFGGILALVALILIVSCITIREYLWAFHGIGCCRAQPRPRPRPSRSPRRANDQGMNVARRHHPVDPQANSTEDPSLREMGIQERRFLRRSWYEYYLKESTQVVNEDDLRVEEDVEEQCEEQKTTSISVLCNDGSRKVVNGSCSICITEYEVGERLVRSPLEECPHVFHEDCMLQWLATGRKTCPTCRKWFVPGIKIADQIEAEFSDLSSSTNATTNSTNSGAEESVTGRPTPP